MLRSNAKKIFPEISWIALTRKPLENIPVFHTLGTGILEYQKGIASRAM